MPVLRGLALVASSLSLACVAEARRPASSATGSATAAAEESDDGALDESEDEGESGGAPRLDLASGEVGETREGCNYVDVLFVIDNSGSMCDAQEDLASVLPGFVDAMFDALPENTDIHVALTTTTFGTEGQHIQNMCRASESDAEIERAYQTPAEPVAGNGFQGRLYEHQGQRWFAGNTSSTADRSALQQWFPAAATSVGCDGGGFEFPTAAAGYATRTINAETNEGFLRDEGGVLVLFVLTDGIDVTPDNVLDFHRDSVLAAKEGCGGQECIVTAGLLGADCVPDSNPMIWRFLKSFGKEPVWGDIDDYAGYEAVVASAMSQAIVDTCAEVTPVG